MQVSCAWCGEACWKLAIEPDPLPADTAAACTSCALKRGYKQKEMDNERFRKENPLGTPISELSGRPGEPGYERFCHIADSWGFS